MVTLMLYLNECEGGGTGFLEDQEIYVEGSGKITSVPGTTAYTVHPEPGLAIIFPHALLHEGEALTSREKYILRSEVMYNRVSGGVEVADNVKQAMEFRKVAEELESEGRGLEAVVFYKKAFRLCPEIERFSM